MDKLNIRIKNLLKVCVKRIPFLGILFLLPRTLINSRKYRKKYKRIISGQSSLSDIEVISIEFCSVCNLSCRYCFLEKNNRPAFLDIGIYKKLLAEICENGQYRIKIMEWPISGCFFLHPQYRRIIEITKEYKEKYPDFRPWIILNDNMMLFDKDKVDFILKEGVVDQIICSIDGVNKDTFEHMRPKADFDTVLANTDYLLRKKSEGKSRIVVQINNGRDEKSTGKMLDPRLKEIFSRADLLTNWEPVNWNASFHKRNPRYNTYPFFCSFVFESVSLSTSGAITKCCMDLKEATRYGDFSKNTLESIWFSEARRAFLRAMHEGRRHLIPGCDSCSISYVSQNKFLK